MLLALLAGTCVVATPATLEKVSRELKQSHARIEEIATQFEGTHEKMMGAAMEVRQCLRRALP